MTSATRVDPRNFNLARTRYGILHYIAYRCTEESVLPEEMLSLRLTPAARACIASSEMTPSAALRSAVQRIADGAVPLAPEPPKPVRTQVTGRVDDEVLAKARAAAESAGITLTRAVECALLGTEVDAPPAV